mmetsp:Transcript_38631/g.36985  ORF Transcript_38631/g.36985 Transcript_38631/m.36985 type:complete len:148 (-) Transcript_38631:1712-2155(-)
MILQYTKLGDSKEKTTIRKINMAEKDRDMKYQYQQLLIINDRLLLNKKTIWASFFICYSLTRNLKTLFYDLDKKRKVEYIRVLAIIGFFWVIYDSVLYWAFNSFPINFYDYPLFNSNWLSTIFLCGIIYGYDLLLFYIAFQLMFARL